MARKKAKVRLEEWAAKQSRTGGPGRCLTCDEYGEEVLELCRQYVELRHSHRAPGPYKFHNLLREQYDYRIGLSGLVGHLKRCCGLKKNG